MDAVAEVALFLKDKAVQRPEGLCCGWVLGSEVTEQSGLQWWHGTVGSPGCDSCVPGLEDWWICTDSSQSCSRETFGKCFHCDLLWSSAA